MPILFWDVETRSALELGIAGAWRYASDPSTEVLCLGFAVDNGEPQIWIPGKPDPEPFIAAASDSSWRAVAHNYQFERAIATRILEPRHGWPRIPLARQCCSMTLALANALPGELEAAALALGLPYHKDREGYRLMRQMARPRRPRKGEDADVTYWVDSPELRKRLHEYCMRDVEVELQNYRDYDATGRPELEPYCAAASRMLKRTVTPKDEAGRTIGKTADLALGYGGALGAWRRFNPDDTRSDGEILLNIQEWRRTHLNIVRFWRRYESACLRIVRTKQPTELVGRYTRFAFAFENNTLFVALPSGRRLAYPEARIGPGKFEGSHQVYFKDNARGGWTDCRGWSGTFVENAVQALSRDLLAAAMQRLEAAGYQIVLHVHDEIVCEIPKGFGSTAEFHALMTQLPSWADTLPIAAKVWTSPRYVKSKDAIAPKPESTVDIDEADGKTSPIAAATTPVGAPEPAEDDDENGPDWVNIPLADVIGEPLVDGMVSCPFHDDQTPSCRIYEDHFHCFGCGAHGNHLDWLMQVEGIEREEARGMLETWDAPRQIQPRDHGEAKRAYALRLWEEARPPAGTLAARYLSDTRKIDLAALPIDIDSVLRFHARCPFGTGIYNPCLVALVRNALTDAPTGIQRIALTPDAHKIGRRMLGKSGVVKLWPPGSQLVIGEGLETVLAAATRISYEGTPLRPAWSALSAEGLGQFPVVAGIERLIILVDHDPTGKTTASYCASRWERAQRNVIQLTPDEPGFDFNDLIMAE